MQILPRKVCVPDLVRNLKIQLPLSFALAHRRLYLAMAFFFAAVALAAQSPSASKSKPAQHDFPSHWRPKFGGPAGLHYVGAQVCIECHQNDASQLRTPMGLAGKRPQAVGLWQRHPDLRLSYDGKNFQFRRTPQGEIYSDAARNLSYARTLLWAFGDNVEGQTYIYRKKGHLYESRISYYPRIAGLDATMGDIPLPASLTGALGRRLSPDETRKCFVCHTTGSYLAGRFHPHQAQPGVTCEECHGPGSAHVAAMRAGNDSRLHIYDPGRLSSNGQVEFCGSCHRTPGMVFNLQIMGILDVRFQPYRLTLSRCWNPHDRRIGCLACHNPHHLVRANPAWYDSKCLACHVTQGQLPTLAKPGRACPVARQNCVTCHMPKTRLPGAHFRFADHFIRIVRPGEPFPG